MTVRLIAFTDRGRALAERLAGLLGGELNQKLPLAEWTAESFNSAGALIFVGAVGIAVRAVAPYVRGKSEDPCVVVVDEAGRFAVPILSGHLGGGNELAGRIAALIGAQAVITTATDIRGVFAVDLWARAQNLCITNPEKIKLVSSKILAGGKITVSSEPEILGTPPCGVTLGTGGEVSVCVRKSETALCLVPKTAILGIGCRRGAAAESIEAEFQKLLLEENLAPEAFFTAASLDLKAGEKGLLEFCKNHALPLLTFSAEELNALSGSFTASEFVRGAVGADNVCERSAAAAGGKIIVRKRAANGVTLAVAIKEIKLDWSLKTPCCM